MPPEDNTPDFDSMSPEEIMAWMEALAVRQGATEGIISDESARPQVQEIDPSTVDIKDNYIPYGMTAEQWEKKQAEEATKKQAKQASAPPPPPVVETPPPPVVETPPPPVAEAQPSADAAPDFDSMSPEEIMAWMEALAVRQGATEGIISDESARPQVAEIDPNSVDTSQMGNYVPYGMTAEQWEKKQAEEAVKKQAKQTKTPFTPPPQADLPVLDVEEDSPTHAAAPVTPDVAPEPADIDWLSGLASGTSADLPATSDIMPDLGFGDMEQEALPEQFPDLDLSGLGDSLQDLELPNFDLEGLGELDELAGLGLAEGNTDPVSWLNNLVNEESPTFPVPSGDSPFDSLIDSSTPAPDTSSIEWLETLAKKQGVSDEELITRPEVELPELTLDPNFQPPASGDPFDFDAVDNLDQAAMDATDPVAWLENLASAQNAKVTPPAPQPPQELSTEDVMSKLNQGISDPEDMKGWMDKLLEEGAKRQVPDYIPEEDEEEAPIQANIPDWLVEQVGLPPDMASGDAPVEIDFDLLENAPQATDEAFDWLQEDEGALQADAVMDDMPDWLTATLGDQTDEVQAIFQATTQAQSPLTTEEIEVDMNDPWVEAFELERQVAMGIITDEEVIYSNEPVTIDIEDVLEDEPLPMGEPEAVPAWMDTTVAPPVSAPAIADAPAPVAETDMPDWLRTDGDEAPVFTEESLPDWLSGIENTEDVPDWLLETVTTEEPVFTPPAPTPAPPPTPAPVVAPVPRPAQSSPAPVPVTNINVVETLQQARAKVQAGNIEDGLTEYEAVIRANTALDTVVSDLSSLVKQEGNKTNASIYRVLGDGLMRQGNLQQALDTYRRALNLL